MLCMLRWRQCYFPRPRQEALALCFTHICHDSLHVPWDMVPSVAVFSLFSALRGCFPLLFLYFSLPLLSRVKFHCKLYLNWGKNTDQPGGLVMLSYASTPPSEVLLYMSFCWLCTSPWLNVSTQLILLIRTWRAGQGLPGSRSLILPTTELSWQILHSLALQHVTMVSPLKDVPSSEPC